MSFHEPVSVTLDSLVARALAHQREMDLSIETLKQAGGLTPQQELALDRSICGYTDSMCSVLGLPEAETFAGVGDDDLCPHGKPLFNRDWIYFWLIGDGDETPEELVASIRSAVAEYQPCPECAEDAKMPHISWSICKLRDALEVQEDVISALGEPSDEDSDEKSWEHQFARECRDNLEVSIRILQSAA